MNKIIITYMDFISKCHKNNLKNPLRVKKNKWKNNLLGLSTRTTPIRKNTSESISDSNSNLLNNPNMEISDSI